MCVRVRVRVRVRACVYVCVCVLCVRLNLSLYPVHFNRTDTISFFVSQRKSFVSVKIFKSKILMNFYVFEVPEAE